jgi:hypothetical protein
MPKKANLTSRLTLSLFSILNVVQARSGHLDAAVKSCETSPRCSHQQPDVSGGMLFRVNDDRTYCIPYRSHGTCMGVMPRGATFKIHDISTLLAAQ